MTTLVSLDPGLRNPAAAVFVDGLLVAASRIKIPTSLHTGEIGERCRLVGDLVIGWLLANCPGRVDRFITEWPQVYRAVRSKGDPNDLLPLAGIGLAVGGRLGVAMRTPTPAQWIGQLPKATTGDPLASPRGARIWGRLSDQERRCVVVSHDAIDAVGLGLWELCRLEPRRAVPRA